MSTTLYTVSNIPPNATRKRFGLNPIPEYEDKIYIIGSISQADTIEKIANHCMASSKHQVRYVQPQPDVDLEKLVLKCLNNIIWADWVYILPKPDGTLGEGVTYEKVFAKKLGKRVRILTTSLCSRWCDLEDSKERSASSR